jgi:hypothetical protein
VITSDEHRDNDRLAETTAASFAASLNTMVADPALVEVVGTRVIVGGGLRLDFRDVDYESGPPLERAAIVIRMVIDGVQDVLAEITGNPWPSSGTRMPVATVTVRDAAIHVAFAVPGEPDVAMPPIRPC